MNRWIVSHHKFFEHRTLAAAEKECARLQEKLPKQKFRVVRVKDTLRPSDAPQVIRATLDALEELMAQVARSIKEVDADKNLQAAMFGAQTILETHRPKKKGKK
jgi:hypothetical protein